MKKIKKINSTKKLLNSFIPILGMLLGLLLFVSIVILYNDNFAPTDSDASNRVCRKAGTSVVLSSNAVVASGVSVTVNVFKSGGSATYSVSPKLSNVVCSKGNGYFTCSYKSNPLKNIMYSSAYIDASSNSYCFVVR